MGTHVTPALQACAAHLASLGVDEELSVASGPPATLTFRWFSPPKECHSLNGEFSPDQRTLEGFVASVDTLPETLSIPPPLSAFARHIMEVLMNQTPNLLD